jgi:hypothetical protein
MHAACASRHSFATGAATKTLAQISGHFFWSLRGAQLHSGAALQGCRSLHQVHYQCGQLLRPELFKIGFVQGFLEHDGYSRSILEHDIHKRHGMTESGHQAVSLISLIFVMRLAKR